ncbi:MAG: Ldh family oxidoreductase, partial [Nocardioidaceae bacterium]
RFRPREEFVRDVQRFIAYLKDTPKAPGHDEVLYPGEREHRTKQTRLREGIYVEDGTWDELRRIASDLGVRPS